ncbi:MAG: phosphatidate cytidylyltransferase [Myxococcota bacterium]|nr:phosphatidate cytidylyltransferase [Myxococcota bacterium]
MITRIVAAVVALGIVVPALVFGGQLGAELLVMLVVLIAMDELARMVSPERVLPASALLVVSGGTVYAALTWGSGDLGLIAIALCGLAVLLFGLFRFDDTKRGAEVAMAMAAALVYVPVLLHFLPKVRAFEDGLVWVALIMVVTFSGDTGGYFAGRAFGKTKLFPRVSPNKTWEGALGGIALAVVGACVVKALGLPGVGWGHAIALGVLLDGFGVVGDLVESMLKRAHGVKDSGWIMPGHGGILDRVDSLLFTGPVAFAYATVFGLG